MYKRKINTLFVPAFGISDSIQGYRAIKFPEIETDVDSLININNVEISNRVDMPNDLIRYVDDNCEPFKVNKFFGQPIEILHAPSFMCALTWFNKLTK